MQYRKTIALGVLALLLALLPLSSLSCSATPPAQPPLNLTMHRHASAPPTDPAPKAELPHAIWSPAALQSAAKHFGGLPPCLCYKRTHHSRWLAARHACPAISPAAFQYLRAHPHHAPPAPQA